MTATRPRTTERFSVSLLAWLLVPFGASLVACGKPADPSALSAQAALRVQDIVHSAGAGVGFAGDDDATLPAIASGISSASNGLTSGMPSMMQAPAMPPPMMKAMGGAPLMMAMAGMAGSPVPSMMTTTEQLDGAGDTLKSLLQDRILVDSNIESKNDDGAVYLLRPDPTCRPLPADDDPPGTLPEIDATCADDLTRLQVRIDLRTDGDGVRLGLLLGPARLPDLALVIHSDLLALDIDLAQTKAAIDYVNTALADASPVTTSAATTEVGKERYALHKDGAQKVTLSFSILEALDIAAVDATGAPSSEVTIAKSDPLYSLTGDGAAKTLTVGVALGQTDVFTTWDPNGTGVKNRDYHLSLGGVTGQSTLGEGARDLTIAGLGIGETSLAVRGTTIFDLNLNPGDQRRFDVHTTLTGDDMPRFEVTPKFDLSLDYHFAAIASELVTPPASYTLDETYGVLLANGGSPAVLEAVKANDAGFAGGLAVRAGTLTVSTTSVGDPISVPAGKCLTGNSAPAAGSHPILGKLAVVDCP